MRTLILENKNLALLLPALLVMLTVFPFSYTVTVGEPDLAHMVYSLVHGAISGEGIAVGDHYGLRFSFGYYEALYTLVPHGLLEDPDSAARVMNAIGFASAVLLIFFMTWYLSRLWSVRIAVCTAIIAGTGPVFLLLAMSGHPLLPATMTAFAAALVLTTPKVAMTNLQYAFCAFIAWLLFVIALTLRAEVLLLFPFFLIGKNAVSDLKAKPQLSTFLSRGIILSLAFVTFIVLQRYYLRGTSTPDGGLVEFMKSFWQAGAVIHGMAIFAIASGVASIAAALILGLNRRIFHFSRVVFYAPAFLIVPTLLFWLPVPEPARHFLFATFGIALLIALVLSPKLSSNRAAILIALAIAVTNQLVAELIYTPIASRYSWVIPETVSRRSTQEVPLGYFIADQRANLQKTLRARRNAIALLNEELNRVAVISADDDFYFYVLAKALAEDPLAHITTSKAPGPIYLYEFSGKDRSFAVIDPSNVYPEDGMKASLALPRFVGWTFYAEPGSRSRYDHALIPIGRRYTPLRTRS